MPTKPTHRAAPVSPRLADALTNLSYGSLFLLWAIFVVFFGVLYGLTSTLDSRHGLTGFDTMTLDERLWNGIYFSVITATSVGYGDVAPFGAFRALAAIEAIFGVLLLALFVAKLLSHRQDAALAQIHRLSYQSLFANTREGFYIIRKDFSAIIAEANALGSLSLRSFGNLETAYREGRTVLAGIGEFYGQPRGLYTIDATREQLLLEAVARTLKRIDELLETLSRHRIRWRKHTESAQELREFVRTAEQSVAVWQEQSPYYLPALFADIRRMIRRLHAHLGKRPRARRRPPRRTARRRRVEGGRG